MTVTGTIAATISDTADKASKTVSTGRAGTNNISDTGEECWTKMKNDCSEEEQAGAELGQAQLKLGLIELEFNFV